MPGAGPDAADEVWRFYAEGDEVAFLRLWDLEPDREAEEFVESFVTGLFRGDWNEESQVGERRTMLYADASTEQSPGRCGLVHRDGQRIYQLSYRLGEPGMDADTLGAILGRTVVRGLSIADMTTNVRIPHDVPGPSMPPPPSPLEDTCCGFTDDGNPYGCYGGNCTWWAHYARTCDLPDSSWGNAWMWLGAAQADGYNTGSAASMSAIFVQPNYHCYNDKWGHVGYLTDVDPGGGSYEASEMGYLAWSCERTSSFTTGGCGESFIYNNRYGPEWDFCTGTENTQCFDINNFSSYTCNGATLQLDPSGNDPQLVTQGAMDWDGSSYPTFEVRMRTDCDDTTGQIFYSVDDGEGTFDAGRVVTFTVDNDDSYHNYAIDMTAGAYWAGHAVRRIRFDPVASCNNGGTIWIDWMRISSATDVDIGPFEGEWTGQHVELSWSATDEDDVFGYQIMRSEEPDTSFAPINADWIRPDGGEYTFEDADVRRGKRYFYYVEALDLEGLAFQSESISVRCELDGLLDTEGEDLSLGASGCACSLPGD